MQASYNFNLLHGFVILAVLGVLLAGFQPLSYAEIEKGKNYDEEIISINSKGMPVIMWSSASERLYDGNSWVDFIQINPTEIHTAHGNVLLDEDSFYFSNKNQNLLWKDTIKVKYADISDLTLWSYPNGLNSETPSISWNGTALISEKENANIGNIKYIYLNDGNQWKTQLEATNLSGLTTKVFGFDQTFDLYRDTINFGGVQRNLDNFNNTSFDDEWIVSHEAELINLLNGFNFDLDLAMENLHSITVYDTGVNSSRLVFDYRMNEVLLPGQKLIIDPVYSEITSSDRDVRDSDNSDSCNQGDLIQDSSIELFLSYLYPTSSGNDCIRGYVEFDISGLPGGLIIENSYIEFDVTQSTNTGSKSWDVYSMTTQGSTIATASDMFTEIATGVQVLDDDTTLRSTGTQNLDLSDIGDSNLETLRASAQDWVSYGFKFDDETQHGSDHILVDISPSEESGTSPKLVIVYTSSVIEAHTINETVDVVGDALKFTGFINVTSGHNANVTKVLAIVNGSTINTNTTGQNATFAPYGFNIGPFWYQMDSDDIYEIEIETSIQNQTGTFTNSTYFYDSREFDPDYIPALDPTQGLVNYTFADENFIQVNRDTNSSTFNVECQYFTQSQAFLNDLESGVWENQTDVLFYVADVSGYYYVQCFNDGELFVTAISQNYSNALIPGLVIFDQLGGFFGAPSIVLVILSILSLGTGRNFPIILLIAASVTGILLSLELITLDPGLVVILVIMAGIGLFGIRKFY